MKERSTILLVDDEPRILDSVRMNLETEGFRVLEASNGMEALEKLRKLLPDLVVLDVMMPEMDGFETLREIRKESNVPVIMLTVRADERDMIRGLESGADDYVAKPFSQRVLLSRIRANLRRAAMPASPGTNEVAVDDGLTVDFARRRVVVRGEEVQLRPTEFRLLYHLATNPGIVLTHESLLSRVWGPEYRDETHYLRLYVTYLRQKIEADPSNPKYIHTERGIGYRFVDYRQKGT